MNVLGAGGFLGNAASALLRDGRIVAAIEEEKVHRHWQAGEIPAASMAACLRMAGITAAQVDCLSVVRPLAKGPEIDPHLQLRQAFPNARLVVVEHQAAHAASAFYASPFSEATVLTVDRGGDFRCASLWDASGAQLQPRREWYYPDSLGLLFSRVTELLGFESGAEEHKIQWMSCAGSPDGYRELFRSIVSPDMRLNPDFFEGNRAGRGSFGPALFAALGIPDGSAVPERVKPDVAAALQAVVAERVQEMAGAGGNLCVAGGLFFNALLVRELEISGRWRNVYVQPAAGNAGTAMGAAYWAWHAACGQPRCQPLDSLLLGPAYPAEDVKQVIENCKLRFRFLTTTDEMIAAAVHLLGERQIVAWMQGAMEFGPRALGNRSILASPLDPYSTENLNTFIKHREPFRKFAASVPLELAAEYFETGPNSRSLATVGKVREAHRKAFAGAVLGQDLVRVHCVDAAENPLFHRLLHAAGKSTGLPVLYNTSFNLFGDPLVCTPRDAVRSFYSSGIDAMVAGNFLLTK